jgi:hypothetical protein
VSVELGQPFRLDCQAEPAQQIPNVSWYRNGIELEGPRYMYVKVVCRQLTAIINVNIWEFIFSDAWSKIMHYNNKLQYLLFLLRIWSQHQFSSERIH